MTARSRSRISSSTRSASFSLELGIVCLLTLLFLPLPLQRLGKDPDKYPDAKSQPQVQVALRTRERGGTAKQGDVVQYVFCLAGDQKTARTGQADRAFHPDEIRRQKDLKIGQAISSLIWPPRCWKDEKADGRDWQTLSSTSLRRSTRPSSDCASPSRELIALVWQNASVSPEFLSLSSSPCLPFLS